MTDTLLFAFYGSLRRGMVNYPVYSQHMEYLETVRLPGYKLFALSDYPYAIRAGASDFIVAELFRIESEGIRKGIYQMEIDAGYIFDHIAVGDHQAGIYLFPHQSNESFVPSGDWVSFVRERREF